MPFVHGIFLIAVTGLLVGIHIVVVSTSPGGKSAGRSSVVLPRARLNPVMDTKNITVAHKRVNHEEHLASGQVQHLLVSHDLKVFNIGRGYISQWNSNGLSRLWQHIPLRGNSHEYVLVTQLRIIFIVDYLHDGPHGYFFGYCLAHIVESYRAFYSSVFCNRRGHFCAYVYPSPLVLAHLVSDRRHLMLRGDGGDCRGICGLSQGLYFLTNQFVLRFDSIGLGFGSDAQIMSIVRTAMHFVPLKRNEQSRQDGDAKTISTQVKRRTLKDAHAFFYIAELLYGCRPAGWRGLYLWGYRGWRGARRSAYVIFGWLIAVHGLFMLLRPVFFGRVAVPFAACAFFVSPIEDAGSMIPPH
jgi:hypothetical protein